MTNMVISEMNVWEWQVGPHAVTMIAVHAGSHNEARAARQHTQACSRVSFKSYRPLSRK